MELTVVGCSGSVVRPGLSRIVLPGPGAVPGRTFSLVLDLGPGAFGALYRYHRPAATSTPSALSHLHPDHCLDLCALYVAARYSPTAPWPSTTDLRPDRHRGAAGPRVRRRRARQRAGVRRHRRPVRLRRLAAEPADRTVRGHAPSGRPSGGGVRDPGHRDQPGRRIAGLLRRHRVPARPWSRLAARRRPAAGRGGVPRRARQPARACT